MLCPDCNNETQKGFVKIQDAGFNILNNVTFYPEEERDKKVHQQYITLALQAEGHYCDTCMKVYAIFNEK